MKSTRGRSIAILALTIALCATTVAYAVLQTTLTISGSVTKKGGTWNLTLSNVSTTKSGKATFGTSPSTSGTSLKFAATLNEQEDEVAVKFRVYNSGTINAKLQSDGVVLTIGSTTYAMTGAEYVNVANGVTCGLYDASGNVFSYSNATNITPFQVNAGAYTGYFTLKCKYTTQNSTDSTINVKLQLNYVQA